APPSRTRRGCQLVAVASLASAISLLAGYRIIAQPALGGISDASDSWSVPMELVVSSADLLTAFGVILTNHRYTEIIAMRISCASRLLNPAKPDQAAKILRAQLWLTSIGCMIFVPKPPQDFVVRLQDYLGYDWVGSFGWPGLMSIGLESFGANARCG